MTETDSKNDLWNKLTSDEKADAMAYKNILMNDKKPNRILMMKIQKIHDRYDDFDMSIVP
jgi:hypothetical protein